jgi:hypothetical protein
MFESYGANGEYSEEIWLFGIMVRKFTCGIAMVRAS